MAFARFARHDDRAIVVSLERGGMRIESQTRFLFLLAVAALAFLNE